MPAGKDNAHFFRQKFANFDLTFLFGAYGARIFFSTAKLYTIGKYRKRAIETQIENATQWNLKEENAIARSHPKNWKPSTWTDQEVFTPLSHSGTKRLTSLYSKQKNEAEKKRGAQQVVETCPIIIIIGPDNEKLCMCVAARPKNTHLHKQRKNSDAQPTTLAFT